MCLVPSNCTQKTRANSRQHTRKENERKITIKVQHNPPKANVSVTINFYTFFMQKRNKEKLWNESTTHPRTHLICGLFIHIFNALMQFLCHRNKNLNFNWKVEIGMQWNRNFWQESLLLYFIRFRWKTVKSFFSKGRK